MVGSEILINKGLQFELRWRISYFCTANLNNMNRYHLSILFSLLAIVVFGQSIHQEQLEQYNVSGHTDAKYYESLPVDPVAFERTSCNLNKVVYGWHPYWVGSAYTNYQWDLLSHFSFFSYEVNAADGQPNTTHGWSTSAAVDAALASGNTKVTLCVTLFSGHATFFGSAAAQQTLISNLISLIQSRGAHGVNIDFEGLPASQTANFANFMVDLANQMHAAIPGSEVSTVLYAVDWSNVFDFSVMEPYVDNYIIMGYAYYYGGSATAGPTDPLYHFGTSYNYTLSKTITDYIDKGCPKNKLVLGLPSYGYEWPTSSTSIPSSTTGSGTARTYGYIMDNTSGNYSAANHTWEPDSYSDNYTFNSGGTRQCFISQDSSWRKRLQHVLHTGIAGIGIWALGYDDGYTELWNAMNDYLTDCYEDPCSDEIHDFGGPTKDYYNDEDYTWTIAPPNAVSLDIDFSMFDIEANWDYLYVYDGPNDQAPQISGSPFTGTAGPGQFTTSTGAVTFRFTSDVSTVAPGFLATYTCNTVPAPVAGFAATSTMVCLGDSVELYSTSSDADTYNWSTSSGGLSSTTSDTIYLFPSSSGNYNVTLMVTNATGTDQITIPLSVIVESPAVANATLSATNLTLPGAVVYFTNTSQNSNGYYWDFGDGTSSTDTNPWHEYLSTGVYNGYLVGMNNSCPNDTMYFQITVGTSGLTEWNADQVIVQPNPFKDDLTITTSAILTELSLIDMYGKLIAINWGKTGNGYKAKVNDLAPGMYLIRYTDESGQQRMKRLVKE